MDSKIDVVTGAFSYTGRYITDRLLALGRQVRTLTSHPDRPHPLEWSVSSHSYDFDRPGELTKTLQGTDTFYNTYWVRYPYGSMSYEKAIHNSRVLFEAAKKAGVRRVVHVSIANPSKTSPLAYYSGKAHVEEALLETRLSYAIFRPTIIFGKEDVLMNNIAWMVRHFPVFAIPGDGQYGLQPIYVGDLAELAVQQGLSTSSVIMDAVGPETYSYEDLVKLMAKILGRRVKFAHVSPGTAFLLSKVLGWFVKDVILTKEEIDGLSGNLLVSSQAPVGKTRLSEWLHKYKVQLGLSYRSELKRHFQFENKGEN